MVGKRRSSLRDRRRGGIKRVEMSGIRKRRKEGGVGRGGKVGRWHEIWTRRVQRLRHQQR